MAAKGYATESNIEADLGVTFDATQQAQVAAFIEDAEAAIDAYTGRAWLTGAITAEPYYPYGPDLFLRQAPIASVQSVKGTFRLSTTETTLTADADYEIRDLTRGRIYLAPWASYDWFLVSYTPAATVPRLVNQATRLMVEERLQAAAAGGSGAIKSFSAFGQVSVTFRDDQWSPQLRVILDSLRAPVLV